MPVHVLQSSEHLSLKGVVKMSQNKISEEVSENGVTKSMLLKTAVLGGLALLLTLPNIYLDNQIYYESREITQLHRIKVILEEEQRLIRDRLEEVNVRENLR